jgi:hypothetical protein
LHKEYYEEKLKASPPSSLTFCLKEDTTKIGGRALLNFCTPNEKKKEYWA